MQVQEILLQLMFSPLSTDIRDSQNDIEVEHFLVKGFFVYDLTASQGSGLSTISTITLGDPGSVSKNK